jgi:purine-binding chemotaxis protein CheW
MSMQTAVKKSREEAVSVADRRAGKYLSFHLGREEYAVPVLKVREIIGIQDITAVPQTPAYVRGVINLRGKVIPVVDFRLRFGLPPVEYNQRTCIIVVQIENLSRPLLTGMIVDGVSEVANVVGAEIEDTPDFGRGVALPYVLGMAKWKGKVKILLDIDQVLSGQELESLEAVLS